MTILPLDAGPSPVVTARIKSVIETHNGPTCVLRFTIGTTELPEVMLGYDGSIPLLEALRRAQAGKRVSASEATARWESETRARWNRPHDGH